MHTTEIICMMFEVSRCVGIIALLDWKKSLSYMKLFFVYTLLPA